MRAAWLADIHLNFLGDDAVAEFAGKLAETPADIILLAGDVTEGPEIARHLGLLARCRKPVYFVFGNHDFYRSTFARTRAEGERVMRETGSVYLTTSGRRPLSSRSFIAGHDGWADGRAGGFFESRIDLNDYHLIGDFAGRSKEEILITMRRLADDASGYLLRQLEDGFRERPNAILLTHAPPFREAHLDPRGRPGDDDWSPHFVQAGLGDRLVSLMRPRPEKRLIVLCGHTHTAARCSPLPNLEVRVGGAVYGRPEVAGIVEIE